MRFTPIVDPRRHDPGMEASKARAGGEAVGDEASNDRAQKRQLRRWAVAVFAFVALAAQGVDMRTLVVGATFIFIVAWIGGHLDRPHRNARDG